MCARAVCSADVGKHLPQDSGPYFAAIPTFVSEIQPVAVAVIVVVAVAVDVAGLHALACLTVKGERNKTHPESPRMITLRSTFLRAAIAQVQIPANRRASAVSWCQVVHSNPLTQQNTSLENGLSSAGHKSSITTSLSGQHSGWCGESSRSAAPSPDGGAAKKFDVT